MKQNYHSNATTNQHIRAIIQSSDLTTKELSLRYNIDVKTSKKWYERDFQTDVSSRPNKINYALTELEKDIIASIRRSTWSPLDDLTETIQINFPHAKRSTVYEALKSRGVNTVPVEKKKEASKFKEYEPGFLHVDVTYLPKLDGTKYYLFVAIDRATRLIFYYIYENKSADNAVDFIKKCKSFFPVKITHMLTDNGLEFTDRFVAKGKKVSGNHKFDKWCAKEEIDHRLTAPRTPKTNGMVERVNGTIKNATVKSTTYSNLEEMTKHLFGFLIFYNFERRHSSLKKELKVKTPFDAVIEWYRIKPEIFNETPDVFKAKAYKIIGTTCPN
jgi:transposase InsO family protein